MSTYARDKLKRYMRKEMPRFVEQVNVSEIMIHLPCLTPSDTETIEAKLRNDENRAAVPCLLKHLMRRQNWPEELIYALEICELTELAADLRRDYYSHNNQGNIRPNAPAAHVHEPPPPPPPVSIPAAVVLPPLAPPEPAAQVLPPPAASAQPETLSNLAAEASSNAASSSDRTPLAPQSPQMQLIHPQATSPASTETPQHPTAATSPSPPPVHQEQEENSDVDLQVVSGNKGDEASGGDSGVSWVSSEVTPDPEPPVQPLINIHAVAATLQPRPVQTATSDVSPPQSPSPPQTDLDETDESTCTTITPENCPVQETAPKKAASAVLEPEEHNDPTATRITENCQHTVSTGTYTLPADGQNTSFFDDLQMSKPGPLLSFSVSNGCQAVPANKEGTYSGTSSRIVMSDTVPTTQVPAPTPTPGFLSNEEPYSGNTDCLEFSEVAADCELTTQVSTPAVACSGAILVHQAAPTPSPPPCQENGELLHHNEPVEDDEDHCESLSSLGDQEVLVNVVHVSELPSIQNQDGQTQSMLEMLNVSPTKPVQNNHSEPEIAIERRSSVSPELSSHNENCQPSESRAAEVVLELKPQDPVEDKPSSSMKYLTVAGVGIFAIFMAWKLKR